MREIRIGICGCTTAFRDELAGETITIREEPFLVREVNIDENEHRGSLRATRAHFFLDVHVIFGSTRTSLRFIELIPNRIRADQVRVGGVRRFTGGFMEREWRGIPSSQEILEEIPKLVDGLDFKQMNHWLSVMTPPDWVLMR